MGDFEKLVIGALIGATLAYLPRFLANRQKLIANRAFLLLEIDKCLEMAETYLRDKIKAPAYRLSSLAWQQSVPQILGVASIPAEQLGAIQDFYVEVFALNRGLDQADKQIGNDARLDQEHNRNLVKSRNIIKRYQAAKFAAGRITKWPWLS